MKKLSARGQKWLKGIHVAFACMWVGAAICLSVKLFFIKPMSGGELYGITSTMDFIDIFIIIPGAVGVLLTGIVFSTWTNWGWFKHNWIIVKWVICLYGVIFGTYPLGPWMSGMARISKELGMQALSDPTFVNNQNMLMIFGTFQASTLIFALFITTLKPWKKRKGK
ncbi:hypothetical protein ACFL9T_03465 [Thermodesulfobacteriota bacterium]